MSMSERRVMRTIIPASEDPTKRIIHKTGKEPLEVGTIENEPDELLRAVGERVLAGAQLTVSRIVADDDILDVHRGSKINILTVQTRPISDQTLLSEHYQWSHDQA